MVFLVSRIVIGILMVVFGGVNYLYSVRILKKDLLSKAYHISDQAGKVFETPLWNTDMESIDRITNAYMSSGFIKGIRIKSDFGALIERLPENTWIYPGHDYIVNNLHFTLDREPDNQEAQGLLAQVEKQDPDQALVTNLALERQVNTFFRLRSRTVIRNLQERFPDLPDEPDPKTVFLKLRELRNSW